MPKTYQNTILSISAVILLILAGVAFAAPGDLVSDVIIGEGEDAGFGGPNDGVGVAFDGTYLYYSAAFYDPILHRIDTSGGSHLDLNVTDSITGTPVIIQAMAYDASRDKVWAANGNLIYLVNKTSGIAEFKFDTGVPCGLDDGLAYDSTDDSLWWSCDAAQTVYHYSLNGTLLSSFPLAGQMVPECGFDYSSGIAVGGDILYLGADGCNFYFTFTKNGTKIEAFPYPALRAEDMACDPFTFAPTEVTWVRDAYDGHIRAFEIPAGTCGLGGLPSVMKEPIDIKPGSYPNSINPKSRGKIPVAILSTPDFDAPTQVNKTSLTFGRTGDEQSLAFCNKSPEDVNNDGLLDQVCHFYTQSAGFQAGDTEGIIRGKTVDEVEIEGRDSVRVVSN